MLQVFFTQALFDTGRANKKIIMNKKYQKITTQQSNFFLHNTIKSIDYV